MAAIFFIFPLISVQAVCPVCTMAVGVGVGLSRWLKIDDTITGLWIGGLIISLILWTINWLRRKKRHFQGDALIISILCYAFVIIPLHYTDIMGQPANKIFGLDKLLFGLGIGSIIFLGGTMLYNYFKKLNKNQAYFPFQKVVMPVFPLIILTIIFYFLTKK